MSDSQEPDVRPLPPISSVAGLPGLLLRRGFLSAPSQPGQLAQLEQYQILSVLGEGGMGVVLRAVDSKSGTMVAIKMLKPELADQPQMVHRFLKEARHMQRLKHPNILPALQVSENPALPYFVMPLVEQGSLIQKLSDDPPMGEEECVAIARQVAAALAHAHAKGVIHRDIKPGNVLVDSSGTTFLADFGLARTVFNDSLVDAAKGETGEGTAHYMSPQLARGEAEDTRCDIYALGALLYEMLTGHPPYEGPSTAQILQQIRSAPPEPILKRRPKLSAGLLKVVDGAMAREHRNRYANMADVLADLERLEKGQPVMRPHTAFSLRRIFSVRSRGVVGISCGIAVLAFAVLGFLWLQTNFSLKLLHEFMNNQVLSWAGAKIGDWDGDGESDIVQLNGETLHTISVRGQQQNSPKITKPHANDLLLEMMADIDGEIGDEALVSWSSGTNAHLTALNKLGWPVREFVFAGSHNVHPQWGTNYTRLRPLQLTDLEGDGERELLASVTSTYALHPRGICCFDVTSGQLKWFFETATFVTEVDVCDLEGDGHKEVVVGSNSPGNGSRLDNGTDDNHAYLYVLSSKGELRWRHELAGVYANVKPLNSSSTQTNVLVWVTSVHAYDAQRREPDTGKVLEYDARSNLLHSCDFGVQLTSALAVDLDGDGQREVLAADRLGVLHVLDGNLRELRSITNTMPRYDGVELQLALATNLAGAGGQQVVLASSQLERRNAPAPGNNRKVYETIFHHDNRVVVLDSDLNQIAMHLLAEKWTATPGINVQLLADGAGKTPKLAVLTDKVQILDLTQTRWSLLPRARLIRPASTPPKPEVIFTDDFAGARLDTNLWSSSTKPWPGLNETGHRQFRVEQANGELVVEAKAQHEGGWTTHGAAWLDTKRDFRKSGDSRIDIKLTGTNLLGISVLSISDGQDPADPEDLQAVRLLAMPGKNDTASRNESWPLPHEQVRIDLLPAHQAAVVYPDARIPEQFEIVDLSRLRVWRLRFYALANSSAANSNGMAQFRIKGITATAQPSANILVGHVIDSLTRRPIAGATIKDETGAKLAKTLENGGFKLSADTWPMRLRVQHDEYFPSDEKLISGAARQGGPVTVELRKRSFAFGEVVDVIPYALKNSPTIGFWGTNLCALANEGEGFAAESVMRPVDVGARGLLSAVLRFPTGAHPLSFFAQCGDRLVATMPHPGGIYELTTGKHSMILKPEASNGRVIDWLHGCAFDGELFWFVEADDHSNSFGLYAVDMKGGKIKGWHPSGGRKFMGLAWDGDKKQFWVSEPSKSLVYALSRDFALGTNGLEPGRQFRGNYGSLAYKDGYLWGVETERKQICKIKLTD